MNLLMLAGDTSVVQGRQGAFYNTLSAFATYWNKVDILTPRVPGVSRYDCFENVSFYPSPWPKPLQPVFIRRKGRTLAVERQYHLIVSHDYGLFLNGLGAAALSRAIDVPYVSEVHHVDGYPRAADLREWLQPWLTRRYLRWARGRARAFRITNQAELKPLLRRWGVPEHQLHLLYSLYLDFEIFRPATVTPEFDAIFVGRLTPNKSPKLFLAGLGRAREQLGNLRALLLGQGRLRVQLERQVDGLGLTENVEFRDWVATPSELADLYRRARCLVCTSYSEGGPRVVAEALACGTPVITTRVGLARELVRDGENGFQIDWSAHELADRMVQIVSGAGLHARLSAAAPAAVQRFEKSRVIREYAMGYQKLAVKPET